MPALEMGRNTAGEGATAQTSAVACGNGFVTDSSAAITPAVSERLGGCGRRPALLDANHTVSVEVEARAALGAAEPVAGVGVTGAHRIPVAVPVDGNTVAVSEHLEESECGSLNLKLCEECKSKQPAVTIPRNS